MHQEFIMRGTCAMKVSFDLNDNKLSNIRFIGGCPGNLLAISKLCEGMDADEVIKRLEGNRCGNKTTSCADQFAKAIKEIKNK